MSLFHASGFPASPTDKEVDEVLHRLSFIPAVVMS